MKITDLFKKRNNPVTSVFKKISNTANKIFSKSNMNEFRDKLSDVLQKQGNVLTKISAGIGAASPILMLGASALAPEVALPLGAMLGASGLIAGGAGGLELAGANLLNPKTYKNKSGEQVALETLNRVGKSVGQIMKSTK